MMGDLLSRVSVVSVVLSLAGAPALASNRVDAFEPLGHFLVPGGGSAEIVSATPDGSIVLYSSAVTDRVGMVDFTDPRNPTLIREIVVNGEPTSVASSPDGRYAMVVVKTSRFEVGKPPAPTPGLLLFISIEDGSIAGGVNLGIGPDSIAVTEIGGRTVAVVAVENEPIIVDASGNFVGGDAPGNPLDVSPKGMVQVVTVNWEALDLSDVADVRFDDEAALTALGLSFPADPQPEYVDIRGMKVAATLQENNAVAIIDISEPLSPVLETLFSLGRVADRRADLTNNQTISLTQTYPLDVATRPFNGFRMADAVAWNAAGTALFTADEGELNFTGGRGWSGWLPDGTFLWDDGGSLEVEAVARGHYPDARSQARGIETEGIETGFFGRKDFAFVTSERGGFIAVYDVTSPAAPRFVQLLPAGWRPEALKAMPEQGLLLVANEGEAGSGTIGIYQGIAGPYIPSSRQPVIRSRGVEEPWGALSGLAADPSSSRALFAVPDSALISSIFRIEVLGPFARLRHHVPVLLEGKQAKYDLEGIAIDTSIEGARGRQRGFWLCSEGNAAFGAANYLPNLLIQVDRNGNVLQEIRLPEEVDPPTKPESNDGRIRNNGFEGVTVSSDGRYILGAIQREYLNEPAIGGILHTRIARFDLKTDTWEFFLYPLEIVTEADDWMGLSEILHLGNDQYAVIERDKLLGARAVVKTVQVFSLRGVRPFAGVVAAGSDLTGHVIRKRLLADVLEDFAPFEKVEGLALTSERKLWAMLDNDGGQIENRLVRLGRLGRSGNLLPDDDDDDDDDKGDKGDD